MLLRQARPEDSKAAAVLLAELGYGGQSEAEIQTRLEAYSKSSNDIVIVAENEGRVVGLASLHVLPLFHLPGPWGRLTALVVSAEARGLGIGAQLVLWLENWAREKGCVQIEVTSGAQRMGAHEFYARLGYEIYPGRRFLKKI